MVNIMKASEIFRKTLSIFFEKKIIVQSTMADALGYHRTTLNSYIKGRINYSEDKREEMVEYLGFGYIEFLELGRRMLGSEPFYWALLEAFEDVGKRKRLIKNTKFTEEKIRGFLRQKLMKDAEKEAAVEALGMSIDSMVDRGRDLILTNPKRVWSYGDSPVAPVNHRYTFMATPVSRVGVTTIGGRLKLIRNSWKLSQKGMATRVGVGLSSYQYYERDERELPVKLLEFLTTNGVDASWLLSGTGEMFSAGMPKTVVGYDAIVAEHFDIVLAFKNKMLAKTINGKLVKLEAIDPDLLEEIDEYIDMKLRRFGKSEKQDGEGVGKGKTGKV